MSACEPWEAKLAWQIARQARGCPPDSILHGEENDQLSNHLSLCPFCRELRSRSLDEALEESALAREVSRQETAPAHTPKKPSPGDLCRISSRLAGWGPRGRYYNPPSVLVLELPQDLPGVARVAPVYDDLCLAGPRDVALGNGIFAESWNTFSVNVDALEYCGYSVERESVEEVLLTAAAPWTDLEPGTHLEAFRRLEVETAAFFALQVFDHIIDLDLRESRPISKLLILFHDPGSVKTALSNRPDVRFPEESMDVPATLALARFEKTELPLAAAEDVDLITANVAIIRGNALDFRPVLCELRHYSSQDDKLVVGGKVLSPLPLVDRVELYGQWTQEGSPPRECDQSFLDAATGFFRVMFRNMTEDEFKSGRLFLLVVGTDEP